MPNDSLPQRLLLLNGFQKKYRPLVLDSVRKQFRTLKADIDHTDVDMGYLLTCASIFAQSSLGDCQDAALRIAQYTLTTKESTAEQREAAVIILDTLTNYPAIQLAFKRKHLAQRSLEEYPLPLMMDMLKRRLQFSLWNEASEELIPVNRFQAKVYSEYSAADALSISAPTSSGKSFIFLQIIVNYVVSKSAALIVYIVPTRALIQQVVTDINDILKKSNIIDTSISSVPSLVDDGFKKHIFVLTQERLHWLLSDCADFAPDCLIVDEAQKIGDHARGVILQQTIEEAARRNSSAKILFASPMTDNPGRLLSLLGDGSQNKRELSSNQVTVNQNLLWVNCENEAKKKWKMQLCLKEDVIDLGTFTVANRASSPAKRLPFVAHALSEDHGGNLIYANGAADAEKYAQILYDMQGEDVDDDKIDELIKLVKKSVHAKYALVAVLKRRVAFHYGNMPLLIKNEIESLFKSGHIKYLVCTSTLLEGINLPAQSIFVRAPRKGKGIPMNAVDFWNLAGRAGRQGKEFQGNIICVDTNQAELWKDSLYMNKAKYPIHSAVDDTLKNNSSEIVQYINDDLTGTLTKRNPLFDHTVTYVLEEYSRNQNLNDTKLSRILDPEWVKTLNTSIENMLSSIDLPQELLLKHQGVSPLAQQALYTYFSKYGKEPQLLVPLMPEAYDAVDSYNRIISRIQKHIEGQKPSPINYYRAMLVVKWMRGNSLAQIISENEKYFNSGKSKTKKGLPAIIRDTMRDIEEFVRFRFVKFSSCYVDVLKHYFTVTQSDLIEQVPSLNIWLEFGASQSTQISLMNLGLSRTTSIALSEYITADNYTSRESLEWINDTDIDQLDLSEIIKDEIKKIQFSSYLNRDHYQ